MSRSGPPRTLPFGHTADFVLGWNVVGGTETEAYTLMTRQISAGFVEAMRIPMVRGRSFSDDDGPLSAGVAVINRAAASLMFSGDDPLGRQVTMGGAFVVPQLGMIPIFEVEIVGVIADTKFRWLDRPAEPEIYLALDQAPFRRVQFAIRTTDQDPRGLIGPLREGIATLDSTLPVEFTTMTALVDAVVARERFTAQLLGVFAVLALTLAAVGIYGVISYSVNQRSGEMAIRKSLGATGGDLIKLVMRQGLLLSGIGIGAGLIAAWALRRVVAAQLHEVSASDPAGVRRGRHVTGNRRRSSHVHPGPAGRPRCIRRKCCVTTSRHRFMTGDARSVTADARTVVPDGCRVSVFR